MIFLIKPRLSHVEASLGSSNTPPNIQLDLYTSMLHFLVLFLLLLHQTSKDICNIFWHSILPELLLLELVRNMVWMLNNICIFLVHVTTHYDSWYYQPWLQHMLKWFDNLLLVLPWMVSLSIYVCITVSVCDRQC